MPAVTRKRPHPALSILLLGLAVLPSVLVGMDRVLGRPFRPPWLQSAWCSIPGACVSAWPSYFLIVFMCAAAAIPLVLASRPGPLEDSIKRSSKPKPVALPDLQRRLGLGLFGLAGLALAIHMYFFLAPKSSGRLDYLVVFLLFAGGVAVWCLRWDQVRSWMLPRLGVMAAYFMGLGAISRALWELTSTQRLGWLTAILLAAAALLLYRWRHQTSPAFWLLLLAIVVWTLQLDAYYFSAIGDEYSFYGAARFVAEGSSLSNITGSLFDGSFVYGTHPYLSSAFQAIFVRLYDNLGFGWRFSSIAAGALAVVLFHFFFSTFLGPRVAFAAAFFLASSHYLMSFSRIGYNSSQALLAMGLAMSAAAWVVRSKAPLAWWAAGFALGFCFYVFPAALFVPPIVVLLLLVLVRPSGLEHWRLWGRLMISWLVTILPLLFQADYWSTKLTGTLLAPEAGNPEGMPLLLRLLSQFGYASFAFLYTPQESHFVTVGHLDLLTATLVIIGLAVLLSRIREDKIARLLLAVVVLFTLLVGATHQYQLPPTSRMFMLVPWYCLLAALGLCWLSDEFGAWRIPRPVVSLSLVAAFTAVLGLNLHMAYGVSIDRTRCCRSFVTSFVQLSQNLHSQSRQLPQAILLAYPTGQYDVPALQRIVQAEYVDPEIRPLVVEPAVDAPNPDLLTAEDQIVVLSPALNATSRTSLEVTLRAAGHVSCPLLSVSGYRSFEVWYNSGLPSPCTSPSPPRGISSPALPWFSLAATALAMVYAYRTANASGYLQAGHAAPPAPAKPPLRSGGSSPARKISHWLSSRLADFRASAVGSYGRANVLAGLRPRSPHPSAVPKGPRRRELGAAAKPTLSPPLPRNQRGEFRRALWLLSAGIVCGGIALWLLRQPPMLSAIGPWLLLVAAMFAAAHALVRLDKWLPHEAPSTLVLQPTDPSRRRLGLVALGLALLITALIIARLWPDFRANWHGTPIAWLLVIALTLFASRLLGQLGQAARGAPSRLADWARTASNRRLEALAFVMILSIGLFLRLYQLESMPPGLYQDETSGGLDALYILEGRPASPFATGWGWVPNGYFYYVAMVLRIFGTDWWGLKLVSLIPMVLALPAIYALGRLMYGPLTGLLAMALLAISRWHFSFSRWVWMVGFPPLFQVLAFFFLIRGFRRRNALDFAVSGILVGLSLYTYFAARLAAIAFALVVVYWLLSERRGPWLSFKANWHGAVILGLSAGMVLAPLAVTFAKDPTAFGRHVSSLSVFHAVEAQHSLQPLVNNVINDLRMFHQLGPGNGRLNLPRAPMLDPVTGLLLAIGTAFSLLTWRDRRSVMLLIWFVVGMAGSYLSVLPDGPNAFRAITALPALVIMQSHTLARLLASVWFALHQGPRTTAIAALASGACAVIVLSAAGIWDSALYFGPQSRSLDVARAFNPLENGIGRATVEALKQKSTVYMEPYYASGQSVVKFLAYDAASPDTEPLEDPPYQAIVPALHLPLTPDSRDAVLLLDPKNWALRPYLASLYPNADFTLATLADSSPLYMRVDIPARDLQALHGLTETLVFADGTKSERHVSGVDPAPMQSLQSAEWTGTIRIPSSGVYDFLAGGGMQLELDGEPWIAPRYLGLGMYDLRAVLPDAASTDAALLWEPPNLPAEPLPEDVLWDLPTTERGLLGEYWSNMSWHGEPLFRQVAPFIVLAWPADQQAIRHDEWSARFSGSLRVPESGVYEFRVEADDGARLTIDGKVTTEGMIPGRQNDAEGAADLSVGDHQIQLDYFQKGGSMALRLYWRRPGEAWSPIPPESLLPAHP